MAITGLMGLLSWVPRVGCMGAHIGICFFHICGILGHRVSVFGIEGSGAWER